MKHKELEEVWARLFDAKCPMDLFGEVASVEGLEQKILETKAIWESIQPDSTDGNLDYRLACLDRYFTVFSKWAREAFELGTYAQKLPYRVKLQLTVKEVDGKKYFFVEDAGDLEVFFPTLDASCFEGYDRYEKFRIFRGAEKILEGYVSYEGTHAACERFIVNGAIVPDLEASLQRVGDVVEVETIKHSTSSQFALMTIRSSGLISSLRKAFKEHNGELDKQQFSEVIIKSDVKTFEKITNEKRFVLA